VNYSKFLTVLLTPERVELYLLCKHTLQGRVPARQPCSGDVWCIYTTLIPSGVAESTSLVLIRVERGKVSAPVITTGA
jgi:hypothetical protein